MSERPIGPLVASFAAPAAPGPERIEGRFVTLERLDSTRHAEDLFAANRDQDWVWDYMPYGPFDDISAYRDWQAEMAAKSDPFFYALRDNAGGQVGGLASYLRIDPANGVIEIGHIWLSPALQRTREATDAIFLMMRHAFDELGVRRLEWKCDALNAPSRAAAKRFGFTFEGIFRQHFIVKGRNRDTAWYAITDADWPEIRKGFETWLRPENFSSDGTEIGKLRVPGAGAKAGEKS